MTIDIVRTKQKQMQIERIKIIKKLNKILFDFCKKQGGHWFNNWEPSFTFPSILVRQCAGCGYEETTDYIYKVSSTKQKEII